MTLFLSSVVSGLIATGVMMVFLYLPRFWQGLYYDTLGALGSILLDRVDARTRIVGAVLLLAGGVIFAFFYGWYTLMFLDGPFSAPVYTIFQVHRSPSTCFSRSSASSPGFATASLLRLSPRL